MSWLLIVGLVESCVIAAVLFYRTLQASRAVNESNAAIKEELAQKRELWGKIEALQSEMVDPVEYERVLGEVAAARDALKAERGRVIITQAELDSIEIRLRQLDEIARELEASALETKEELRILQKREGELKSKNEELRVQIAHSTTRMEALMSEIEMSVQLQEQIKLMKADLLQSEQQVELLMAEIQKGNEQYVNAKRRYDALDVEYAQLYQQYIEQNQK